MVLLDGPWEPTLARLASKLDRPTSIHHWQLRDLVACDDAGSIYCVHDRTTTRYNMTTGKSSVMQKLNFAPNCMTVDHGYIAAGGPNSQIDIQKVMDGEEVYTGQVGGIINNSLRIAEGPIGHLLFVCNNDETIKVFSLPSMEQYATLEFQASMNYSAVSRDCHWLVGVGDSPAVYLYEATATGYRRIQELKEYTDVGMCCAWDSKGVRFAAASQDGTTCVWDRRTSKPVVRFKCTVPCRNVKFSAAPMDLMVFAEETDVVHLVDTRKWTQQQFLRVHRDVETDISGVCFLPDATSLFVGLKDGILVYDIDTVARRRFSEGSLI